MTLATGTRLGVYEIAALLGAGGMGEVYRARDTKLGRDVAIKVLPASLALDPERLARFEREARLLASLNHPNIGAIYGVEESSGLVALVLELVEGETLADRIAKGSGHQQGSGLRAQGSRALQPSALSPQPYGGLPLVDVLNIARQIADALDAAHERGIVHRDLKPANIVISHDGTVKVLDFGLAKEGTGRAGQGGSDLTHSPTVIAPTIDGVLLGTAPYMSPEQARGKPVDKRTDIWAFGCVLFEMLTGRRAFPGETTSDTVAAVLEHEPDWSAVLPATPPHVSRLLRRCLEKDPRRRCRDIGDARLELGDIGAADDARHPVPHAPRVSRARRPLTIAAAVAVAAVAVVLGARIASRPPGGAGEGLVERLTFDAGLTEMPALSPDGRLLAFASDRAGRDDLDIWVQQMAGGALARLTDDPADDSSPDFSPDGSQIVFRSDRNNGGVYLMPALGGPPRLIARNGRDPRFSPDGSRIAYWTGQFRGDPSATASSVFVVPLGGGSAVQVARDLAVAREPVWSPNGTGVLILGRPSARGSINEFDVWFAALDGAPAVRTHVLDERDWRISSTVRETFSVGAWTRSGLIGTSGGTIWQLPLASDGRRAAASAQLMFGPGSYRNATVIRDGQIVFANLSGQRVIERVRLTGEASPTPPVALHTDASPFLGRASETRDGLTLVFERRTGHRTEIWQKDLPTGHQQMIIDVESEGAINPTVSADGSRVAYSTPTRDRQSVTVNGAAFVVETSGGVPKPLCTNCGAYEFLSDNRRVVVAAGDQAIQFIDVANGSVQDVVKASGARVERPSVSPDDRFVAFRKTTGSTAKIVVTATPDANGQPAGPDAWLQVDEPTTTGRPAGWSPDSRVLYLLLDADGYRCLWAQKVGDRGGLVGTPQPVRHFHDHRGAQTLSTSLGNAITADGFLYETTASTGDLWRLTRPAAAR